MTEKSEVQKLEEIAKNFEDLGTYKATMISTESAQFIANAIRELLKYKNQEKVAKRFNLPGSK